MKKNIALNNNTNYSSAMQSITERLLDEIKGLQGSSSQASAGSLMGPGFVYPMGPGFVYPMGAGFVHPMWAGFVHPMWRGFVHPMGAPLGSTMGVSPGSLSQASAGSLSQASAGSLSQASAGSLSQASAGSLSQVSAGSLSQVSAGSLSQASAGSLSQASAGSSSQVPSRSSSQVPSRSSRRVPSRSSRRVSAGSSRRVSARNLEKSKWNDLFCDPCFDQAKIGEIKGELIAILEKKSASWTEKMIIVLMTMKEGTSQPELIKVIKEWRGKEELTIKENNARDTIIRNFDLFTPIVLGKEVTAGLNEDSIECLQMHVAQLILQDNRQLILELIDEDAPSWFKQNKQNFWPKSFDRKLRSLIGANYKIKFARCEGQVTTNTRLLAAFESSKDKLSSALGVQPQSLLKTYLANLFTDKSKRTNFDHFPQVKELLGKLIDEGVVEKKPKRHRKREVNKRGSVVNKRGSVVNMKKNNKRKPPTQEVKKRIVAASKGSNSNKKRCVYRQASNQSSGTLREEVHADHVDGILLMSASSPSALSDIG